MTDEKVVRPGKPHEFAQLVTQSIENIMLNGVVLRLDGGSKYSSKRANCGALSSPNYTFVKYFPFPAAYCAQQMLIVEIVRMPSKM